jgi:hypothetical protein
LINSANFSIAESPAISAAVLGGRFGEFDNPGSGDALFWPMSYWSASLEIVERGTHLFIL